MTPPRKYVEPVPHEVAARALASDQFEVGRDSKAVGLAPGSRVAHGRTSHRATGQWDLHLASVERFVLQVEPSCPACELMLQQLHWQLALTNWTKRLTWIVPEQRLGLAPTSTLPFALGRKLSNP